MFCRKCGSYMTDDSRFCPKCGTGVYAPDYAATADPSASESDGFAIAGFVFSLLGGLLGLIFSIIALARPTRYRGLAFAGLIISIVWFVVVVVAIAIYI